MPFKVTDNASEFLHTLATEIVNPGTWAPALANTGAKTLSDAQGRTPVDTGRLQASEIYEEGVPDPYSVTVSANTEYAGFVEFGHRTRGGGSFVPAVNYMGSAFEENIETFVSEVEAIADSLIR